jgi:hypothetical protein
MDDFGVNQALTRVRRHLAVRFSLFSTRLGGYPIYRPSPSESFPSGRTRGVRCSHLHIVRTTRNCALPLIMRA